MGRANERQYTVLVVEDDPHHAHLIDMTFARADPNAWISQARSAEEAIAYLHGSWPDTDYGRSRLPSVIILDINMPGIGGLGFLEWYGQQDRAIQDIPVVVFTSVVDPDLTRRCYELGAREVMVKPLSFSELVDLVQDILDRWHPGSASKSG